MKVSTGMGRLDKLLGGGLPSNSVVLLSGGPGSGKTLFSLKYILDGARKGEKCCFITMNEDKDGVIRACKSIKGLSDIEKYAGKNLAIEYIPMSQSNISVQKFSEIITKYPQLDRVVIDNVNKLLMFSESEKSYRAYLVEIVSTLRNMKSSLLLCETDGEKSLDSGNFESYEADGVIQLMFLDLEEKPIRSLLVHKMRFTSFEPKVLHELKIDKNDVDIGEHKFL